MGIVSASCKQTAPELRRGQLYPSNGRLFREQARRMMDVKSIHRRSREKSTRSDPSWMGKETIVIGTGGSAPTLPLHIDPQKRIEEPQVQPLRIKLDPGCRITGIAVLNDATGHVVFATELSHRGDQIKKALDGRRTVRRSRKNRKTRYRKPRCSNRRRRKGWLPLLWRAGSPTSSRGCSA